MNLSDEELDRYARHILLREVGGAGQAKLKAASVLVVGAGGLGAPVLQYLAAAGVGRIGLVDDDLVSLSNLQRQVIYQTAQIDQPKVEAAQAFLAAQNPHVRVEPCQNRLTAENADALIGAYDLVADCSDNFDTRYLLADRAMHLHRPLVSAAIGGFDGQLAVWKPYENRNSEGAPSDDTPPCLRCLFPQAPEPGAVRDCAEDGILGSVAGVMGTMQATEILKEILGLGAPLVGRMLMFDALYGEFRAVKVKRDPACPHCRISL